MKIIFSTGSFGIPLRVEVSYDLLQKAVEILTEIGFLAEKFNTEFSASLSVQGEEDPGDYYENEVWLEISAGPGVRTPSAHDELISALTGEFPGDIVLMSGGPEGPNAVSYTDVREMTNIYVETMVAGKHYDILSGYSTQEKWESYVREIATTDEEYDAIIQAGVDYTAYLEMNKEKKDD